MRTPAKPYPIGKSIAVGLALAALFSVFSLFFLSLQARNAQIHLTGEVIAVAPGSITIRSARGTDTVLSFVLDAKLRGVASVEAIVEGQHIMTRGNFTEADVFEVKGLRVVRD